MIRVLLVHSNLNSTGGVARGIIALLNELPQDGFEYDLLLTTPYDENYKHLWDRIPKWINVLPPLYQFSKFSDELMAKLRCNGMFFAADIREKVHELNKRDGVDIFRNWAELKKIAPEFCGYDVAFASSEDIALNIVCDCVIDAKRFGWLHCDYKQTHSEKIIRLKENMWGKLDKIICVSQQNAKVFSECYENLKERVSAIYSPIDHGYLCQQAEAFYPHEYATAGNCVKIFTAGSIGLRKGTDFIIEAAKRLIYDGYNIKWFIAGTVSSSDTDDGAKCVRQIEKELREKVILLGYQPNPYPFFANCDIYVHPSRYEGLAAAIQEAQILCKPILATAHSSASEIIVDGETGIICDIEADSLTHKLKMMIDDESIRNRLSTNLKNKESTQEATRAAFAALFNSVSKKIVRG